MIVIRAFKHFIRRTERNDRFLCLPIMMSEAMTGRSFTIQHNDTCRHSHSFFFHCCLLLHFLLHCMFLRLIIIQNEFGQLNTFPIDILPNISELRAQDDFPVY